MPKNINSAYRIKEVLKAISKADAKLKVNEVWANFFAVEKSDSMKLNSSLSRLLSDIHDEVELVQNSMQELGYSDELFVPSLDICKRVFSPHLLESNWQNIKQLIKPDVINAVGFCSEILPNEEELINEEDLKELIALVTELKSKLSKSQLSPTLSLTLKKQISKIEESIVKYKVTGVKEFEDVLKSALGEVITNDEIQYPENDLDGEITLLKKCWRKSKEIMDGAVSAERRVTAISKLGDTGGKLLDFIDSVI